MARVYVGNLVHRVTERDLEDEFRMYGVLRRPPGYAFVEFDDRRDAVVEDLQDVAAYHLAVVAATADLLHIIMLIVIHLMPMEIKAGWRSEARVERF